MPQGRIVRVDGDSGWVLSGGEELRFRHWALAPEQGGRFPKRDSYVQFSVRHDPRHGDYIGDLREITPPQDAPTGRLQNVYADAARPNVGIQRVVEGERVPLEAALAEARAHDPTRAGIREVQRPAGPLHAPVSTEWELPATTGDARSADAKE